MKNLSKSLEISSIVFSKLSWIDDSLLTIEVSFEDICYTFWQKDMINYLEVCVYEDEILLDTNCSYLELPKYKIGLRECSVVTDCIEEFYGN